MNPYASIETVFSRNRETNKLNFGHLRNPAHVAIGTWEISEKIDGMNIRAIVTANGVEVRGRSDNANLPGDLVAHVKSLFTPEAVILKFPEISDIPDWTVTFYGEGYGAGIQKGGGYSATKKFRCFDICLGERDWLSGSAMRFICWELKVPRVPALGLIKWVPRTLEDLTEILPESIVALEDRQATDIPAEGIVAKPSEVLYDSRGNRVMWKLTFREFN